MVVHRSRPVPAIISLIVSYEVGRRRAQDGPSGVIPCEFHSVEVPILWRHRGTARVLCRILTSIGPLSGMYAREQMEIAADKEAAGQKLPTFDGMKYRYTLKLRACYVSYSESISHSGGDIILHTYHSTR